MGVEGPFIVFIFKSFPKLQFGPHIRFLEYFTVIICFQVPARDAQKETVPEIKSSIFPTPILLPKLHFSPQLGTNLNKMALIIIGV